MTPAVKPTRADYPPVEPVICAKGPLLNSRVETSPERAGHCYRKVDGVWVCRYCLEPRP